MPYRSSSYDDDFGEEYLDAREEAVDLPEEEDDDDSEVIACPACGGDVYEDSPKCPNCGEHVSRSTSPWSGRPVAWIVLGLLGILAVIYVLLGVF